MSSRSSHSPRKLLLVCDHGLNPRLERKLRWLGELFDEITIVRDTSRTVHSQERQIANCEYADYEESATRLREFDNGLVYMAGNRVLKDHARLLRAVSKRNPMIWEIADLPFRRGFPQDIFVASLFRYYLTRVNPSFTVTAPGFMRWLPNRKPWLLSENVPEVAFAEKLRQIKAVEPKQNGPIKIGFPGIIRFLEPLVMLHQFMCEHPGEVELHIWGGAESAWHTLQDEFRRTTGKIQDVQYHGPYTLHQDGIGIYSALDVVWAVYEARQPNVRVALPNRMYEAILSGRWLLTATKTELSKRVTQLSAGYAVPSHSTDYASFVKQLRAALEEFRRREFPVAARDEVLRITQQSKAEFQAFVQQVMTS